MSEAVPGTEASGGQSRIRVPRVRRVRGVPRAGDAAGPRVLMGATVGAERRDTFPVAPSIGQDPR